MLNIRESIMEIFIRVFKSESPGVALPGIEDELVLLTSGLDSLGFAVLVVTLEEELGYDPFVIAEEAVYPKTFGEFVSFYEKYAPVDYQTPS